MISTRFLARRKGKASSRVSQGERLKGEGLFHSEPLAFDLISQLTHMSAVATAGISREKLFEGISRLDYSTSRFFRHVHLVAQRLNYDYSAACEMVAEVTGPENVRNLLLRFSTSLSAGEEEAEFLARETEVELELYGKQYERDMESLRKWTDAYVALMVSATLVVVISLVSMMIYSLGAAVIVGLGVLIIAITFAGGWIISSVAPQEVKTHRLRQRSPEQERAAALGRLLIPIGGLAGAALAITVGLGPALLVASVIIVPVGIVAFRDDSKIDARDRDVAGFLRALGSVLGAVGTSVTEGLSRLNRRSLGSLEPHVRRLYVRLRNNISPDLCWHRLSAETGSELVTRSVRIFWDGLRLGGDAAQVGRLASMYALKVALLRATRRMVASTFGWVAVPLHAVLLGVLLFVTEVIRIFGAKLAEVQAEALSGGVAEEAGVSTVLMYGAPNMAFVDVFVAAVVLMLTATNAFAPYAAGGGHRYKICTYLAIMMFMSGIALIVVPDIVQSLFRTVSSGPAMTGGTP
jgi:flagellar protein FlaJ